MGGFTNEVMTRVMKGVMKVVAPSSLRPTNVPPGASETTSPQVGGLMMTTMSPRSGFITPADGRAARGTWIDVTAVGRVHDDDHETNHETVLGYITSICR